MKLFWIVMAVAGLIAVPLEAQAPAPAASVPGATGQPPTHTLPETPVGQAHTHSGAGSAADLATAAPESTLDQLDIVRRATERYRDFDAARADGYIRFGRVEGPLVGEHWYREDLVDQPLDLARPSTLQYAVVNGERVLVGVAYTVYQRPGEPLPEGFPGTTDHWHVHDVVAIARAAVETRPLVRWLVERRIDRDRIGPGDGRTQLVMLHAWPWLDNPDGAFANEHRALPYVRAGLPAEFARGASTSAAWGIALLTDGTCDTELRRLEFVRLSRRQSREIRGACDSAATAVRNGRSSSAAELNASAAVAWTDYAAVRDRVLTPEQHARLASVVEHPQMGGAHAH